MQACFISQDNDILCLLELSASLLGDICPGNHRSTDRWQLCPALSGCTALAGEPGLRGEGLGGPRTKPLLPTAHPPTFPKRLFGAWPCLVLWAPPWAAASPSSLRNPSESKISLTHKRETTENSGARQPSVSKTHMGERFCPEKSSGNCQPKLTLLLSVRVLDAAVLGHDRDKAVHLGRGSVHSGLWDRQGRWHKDTSLGQHRGCFPHPQGTGAS